MNSSFALRAAVATPHQPHDLCFIPKYKYKINKSRLRSIENYKKQTGMVFWLEFWSSILFRLASLHQAYIPCNSGLVQIGAVLISLFTLHNILVIHLFRTELL